MKVVVTGSSGDIGDAIARRFLLEGFSVYGLDLWEATIKHSNYKHYKVDASDAGTLPDIPDVDILINNAGTQDQEADIIQNNLETTIACTEKYGLREGIVSIVNIASTSAHNGAEFPRYAASKGGVLAYTKWTAMEVAKYGATCNSISPGGVMTRSNKSIILSIDKWDKVVAETLLNKWAWPSEIAEWVYFMAVVNESMTGQDVIVDNGEMSKFNFVW